jgi:predicted ATPase
MGCITLVVLEPLVEETVVLALFDAALSVNDEAFTVGHALGDYHVDAELHRLKGELLLGLADAREEETCFHQALAVSRRQHAKSLELRAAMSMDRLWQRQEKSDDARRLLENVYRWFTEGFDSPDLQDAHKLLDY